MRFIQFSVSTPSTEQQDILIARLSLLNFEGFEERQGELLCSVLDENLDEPEVEKVFLAYGLNYTKVELAEQNWNALWESNFEPVVVDDFCAIRADFHPSFPDVIHEVVITPKMSFGTGHHATTYMMVQHMQHMELYGKQVADFGTGTGILAILAEKLGAEKVMAIDEDDWSIKNAWENFGRNDCNKIVLQKANSFKPDGSFDVILANINRNVIVDNMEALHSHLSHGGFLLLSGLLKEDEEIIVQEYSTYRFKCVRQMERNNWISILLKG